MAKFTFYNGNKGVWGYVQPNAYSYAGRWKAASGDWVISYKLDGVSAAHPARMRLIVKDAGFANSTANSTSTPTSGTITGLIFTDASGTKLIEGRGLDTKITTLTGLTHWDSYWKIAAQGATYTGSANSKASGGWNGDAILTGRGNDIVDAKAGDDVIEDHGGRDLYLGGAGQDEVSYAALTKKITADLSQGFVKPNGGAYDQLISIERLRGTAFDDHITGHRGANQLAGLKGKDRIDGDTGTDWAIYDKDAAHGGKKGIRVDLKKGSAVDGFGTKDRLISIENIRATARNDRLKDDAGDNGFEGLGGRDSFILRGGNDWVRGGAGADTFTFRGNFGADWIGDFSRSQGDRIRIDAAQKFSDLSIKNNADGDAVIWFDDHTVTLNGVKASDLSASDFLF